MKPVLDVVTIGRSSVDLYGQQVGGRLEDMASFSKAVGGCPANIAIGTARLGLQFGPHHPRRRRGRWAASSASRWSARASPRDGIVTDPERLTALVILGVRDENSFPLIFYRDNCADMALERGRYRRGLRRLGRRGRGDRHAFLARQHSGAHRRRRSASPRRMAARWCSTSITARTSGACSATGRAMRATCARMQVTEHLEPILADCDLIVGTEEELHIAGGSEDTLQAIRNIRAASPRHHRVQARTDGLRRVSWRHPEFPRCGREGSGLPRRGLSTCSAPATRSCPASCAAG